jgi:hypothetical protein
MVSNNAKESNLWFLLNIAENPGIACPRTGPSAMAEHPLCHHGSTCALGAVSCEDYAFYRKSKEAAGMIEWQQSELRFNISP